MMRLPFFLSLCAGLCLAFVGEFPLRSPQPPPPRSPVVVCSSWLRMCPCNASANPLGIVQSTVLCTHHIPCFEVPGTPLHLHIYTRHAICTGTAASISASAYGTELNGHHRSLQQAASEISTVPDFGGNCNPLHAHIYTPGSVLAYHFCTQLLHMYAGRPNCERPVQARSFQYLRFASLKRQLPLKNNVRRYEKC